jgi:hypothetical protein
MALPELKQDPDYQPLLDRIPENWGKWVQVGPGWKAIILELHQKLVEIDPNYEIHQIKEKFGGLRYYCSLDGHDEGQNLIDAAEEKAWVTCERCGEPGTPRGGGWISTLCDTHYLLRELGAKAKNAEYKSKNGQNPRAYGQHEAFLEAIEVVKKTNTYRKLYPEPKEEEPA